MSEAPKSRFVRQRNEIRESRERRVHEVERLRSFIGEKPEKIFKKYRWIDSSLDYEVGEGLPLRRSFKEILPSHIKSFRMYIEDLLKERAGKALFAEFGGTGRQIAYEFTPGFFEQSFGIDLFDHNGEPGSTYPKRVQEIVAKRNHSVIRGDLLEKVTYKELKKHLNGKKLDLIIERMARGLEYGPRDPQTLGALLQVWYELLAEDGVMFVQIPIYFNPLLSAWREKILQNFGSLIEIRYALGKEDVSYSQPPTVLFLQKHPGAPAKLPVLRRDEIRRIGA